MKSVLNEKQRALFQKIGSALLLVGLVVFGVWGFSQYTEYQHRAKSMSSVILLRTLRTGYETQLVEKEKPPKGLTYEAIGFVPQGEMRVHLYTQINQVPEEYAKLLLPEMAPLRTENTYRFLAILQSDNRIYFHTIDKMGKVQEQAVDIDEKDIHIYSLPRTYTFDSAREL